MRTVFPVRFRRSCRRELSSAKAAVAASSATATYPTAGTVVRSMQATLAYQGGTSATSSRREVLTYDGSATAKLVITEDGTTRNCTVPLPHGRPTCN